MKKLITLLSILVTTFMLQAQTGELSGTIRDENGEGIKKSVATLMNDNGVSTGISVIADADGHYIFTPLAPGKYNVQLSYNGYVSYLQSAVIVDAGQLTTLNKNLKPDPDYVASPKNAGKPKKK